MKKYLAILFAFSFVLNACDSHSKKQPEQSVARLWNEQLLESIRNDFARPTVHARNLFHFSSASYDAWSTITGKGSPFLLGNTVAGFQCSFDKEAFEREGSNFRKGFRESRGESLNKAISYANYRLMEHRFRFSPGFFTIVKNIDTQMEKLQLDTSFTSTDYSHGNAAALGNYIAQCYIDFGLQDGANESNNYSNQYYQTANPDPIRPAEPGNPDIVDINRWQVIELENAIDQAGQPVASAPPFLSPEWGRVVPFSLQPEQKNTYQRDGFNYEVYFDPGEPPKMTDGLDGGSENFKWTFSMVAIWSSHLSSSDNTMIDISPASIGNIALENLPQSFEAHKTFYDVQEGGDKSPGHAVNPVTGLPYQPQIVKRGDYARILAEFWADGPDSETPPGHWFTILNYVNDHPQLKRKFQGEGAVLHKLEWDVKSYFILGGAMHDVAISAWGIKGWYDYVRPVSAIRAMADEYYSGNPDLGLPIVPGFIEEVTAADPLSNGGANDGKIKLFAWRGPDYINDPAVDEAGVDWILAENWWPYQRPTFVTPPFAGYVSGHSTYSRAAAEVLTALTGTPYFPGGLGEFYAPKNEFLVFEEGPTQDITLQWATYQDASDQCSLSRIWGGIHPPADDIPGRLIGEKIGKQAFSYASQYF